MHVNETLVRRAYVAQAEGDIDAYLDLLSEGFVLHIPGRSRIAGVYRGRDEVRRHFREIAALSEGTFRTEMHDVLASDDHAVGLVNALAERDGRTVDLRRVHVWHVSDGALRDLSLYPADQLAFDGYWA
jgi:ketosteroid isomerase-like protein